MGNFVYKDNGELDDIITPEGRLVNVSNNMVYEYYLKDHLGNMRNTFQVDGGVVVQKQKMDYYPFGMQLDKQFANHDNKYLYNGKEMQDDLFDNGVNLDWLDYGARMYDAQLGKWHTVDPMATEEHNLSMSPYNYCVNNPILNVDPDGMDWYSYTQDGVTYWHWQEGSASVIMVEDKMYANQGETYTQDLGDGKTLTWNQQEATSFDEKVLDKDDWESQRDPIYNDDGVVVGSRNKAGEEGNCFYQAGQMVSNSGATSLGGTANNEDDYNAMIRYMNSQIDQGKAVRVHVDYNNDGVGDHWVTISSRSTNIQANTSTYNFYDPGTWRKTAGTHNTNVFNIGTTSLSGTTNYSGRTYNITAVRRNQ